MDGGKEKSTSAINEKGENKNIIDQTGIKATRKKKRVFSVDDDYILFQNPHIISTVTSPKSSKNTPQNVNAVSSQANIGTDSSGTCWRKTTTEDTNVKDNNQNLKLESADLTQLKLKLTDKLSLNQNAIKLSKTKVPDKNRPVFVEKYCKHDGLIASHKSKPKGNGDTNRSTVLKKVVDCDIKTVKITPEVDLHIHTKPVTLKKITGSTSRPSLDSVLKLSNQSEVSSGKASRVIQQSSDQRTLNVYIQKNNTRNKHPAVSSERLREKNAKKKTGNPPAKQKLPTEKRENTHHNSKIKGAISSSVPNIKSRTSGTKVNLPLKPSLGGSLPSKSESRDKCHEEHTSNGEVCMESNKFSEKQEIAPRNKKDKLPVRVKDKVHDDSVHDTQSKMQSITKQLENDKNRSKDSLIHKSLVDEAMKQDEACKSEEISCKGIKRRKTKDESYTSEMSKKCKNAEVENTNTLPTPSEPQNKLNSNTRTEYLCEQPILEEEKGSSGTNVSIKDNVEIVSKDITTIIDIYTAKTPEVSDLQTDDRNAENAVKIFKKFTSKLQREQSMQPSGNLISNGEVDLSKSPNKVRSIDKATTSIMSSRGGGFSRSPNKVKSNNSLKGKGKVQANWNRLHQMPKLLTKSRQEASEIYKCIGGDFKPAEGKAMNVLPMEVNTEKPTKESAASEDASTCAASDKLKPSMENQIQPEVQPEKVCMMSTSDTHNTVAASMCSVRNLPTYNQSTNATQKSLVASSNMLVAQPVCQASEEDFLISIPEVAAPSSKDFGLLLETELVSVESKFSSSENENVSASVTSKSTENTLNHSQSVTRSSNDKADISKMASSDTNNEPRATSFEDIKKTVEEINYKVLRYGERRKEISVLGRNIMKMEPRAEKDCSVLENTQQTEANDCVTDSPNMSIFPSIRVKDKNQFKRSDFPADHNDSVGTVTPTMPPAEKPEQNENMQMMMKLILGNFYPVFRYADFIKKVVSGSHVNYVERQAMIEPLERNCIQLVHFYKKELSKPGRSEVAIVTELEEMSTKFMIPPLTSKQIAQWLTTICKLRPIMPLRAFVDNSGFIMEKIVIEVFKRKVRKDGETSNSSASVLSTRVQNSENTGLTTTSVAPPAAASVISCAATSDNQQDIALHTSPSSAQVPQHSIPLQQCILTSPPNVSLCYSGQHGYKQPAYTGTGPSNVTTGEIPRVSEVCAGPNQTIYQGASSQKTQQDVNINPRLRSNDRSQSMNTVANQQANPGVSANKFFNSQKTTSMQLRNICPNANQEFLSNPIAQQSGYPIAQYQWAHNSPQQQQSKQVVPHTNNMNQNQRPMPQMHLEHMNSTYQSQQPLPSFLRCSIPFHNCLGYGFVKQPPPYVSHNNIQVPQSQYQWNPQFPPQQNPQFSLQQNPQFSQQQNPQFSQLQNTQFSQQQNAQFLQQQNPQFSQQQNVQFQQQQNPRFPHQQNLQFSQQPNQSLLGLLWNNPLQQGLSTYLTTPEIGDGHRPLSCKQVVCLQNREQVLPDQPNPQAKQLTLPNLLASQRVLTQSGQPTNQINVQGMETPAEQQVASRHQPPAQGQGRMDGISAPLSNSQPTVHIQATEVSPAQRYASDEDEMNQHNCETRIHKDPVAQNQKVDQLFQMNIQRVQAQVHLENQNQQRVAPVQNQRELDQAHTEQLAQAQKEKHQAELHGQQEALEQQHPQIQAEPSSREHPLFKQVSNNVEFHVHELLERKRSVTSISKQTSSVHNTVTNQSSQRVENGNNQFCSGVALSSSSNPMGSVLSGVAVSSANRVANECIQLNSATNEAESEPEIIEVYASIDPPQTTSQDNGYKTPSPAVVKKDVKSENENRVITAAKCNLCQKPAELICSSCMRVFYCSEHCQNQHWDASHKHTCQKDNEDNCQD